MAKLSREAVQAPLVSVIIPVYNGEKYLRRCLDSVVGQTMQDFELIVVDDGSEDSTPVILREYESQYPSMRVVTQANAGQGAARNRALGTATGRYVLFVDADDFIERVTLQVTTERAEQDDADLVHFDWKFIRDKPDHLGEFDYYNIEPFWHLRVLEGADCEQLFRMHSYFSVTNLYRRSFLSEHGIRYEEGQIYEDNPFLAQVFSRAEKVSLVHSPLYAIQANPESSTKQGADTPRHMQDHLSAVRKSFAAIRPRSNTALGDLAEYHLEKFSIYYARRVPKELRTQYAKGFVEILAAQELEFGAFGRKTSWLTRLCILLGVFERNRPELLQRLIAAKNIATPPAKKALAGARKLKRRVRHPLRTLNSIFYGRSPQLKPGSILFLGFDYRFTGNSRALYEELVSDARFSGRQILFATKDSRVPQTHRVRPESLAFTRAAQEAEYVIAETWIPSAVPKHPDSTWIQLWHGTPIKRMLFDSHEREITKARPAHKVNKYKDIQRWDYFVVDGELAATRFSTAFLIAREKLFYSEYPKQARLTRRLHSDSERESVRQSVRIPNSASSQRIALYAPTWRDYNYSKQQHAWDLDFLLTIERLSRIFNRQEVSRIIVKEHDYLGRAGLLNLGDLHVVSRLDIDDLFLLADIVVTDFSSIVFEAQAAGIPVIIDAPDEAKYLESRGLYLDTWHQLADLRIDTVGSRDRVVSCEEISSVRSSLPNVVSNLLLV